MYKIILLLGLLSTCYKELAAQHNYYRDQKAVVYEQVYDDPYDINKLFIGIQPLYAELFATNVNTGFGMEAHYFHKNKFDVKAHFRRPWTSAFYDLYRDQAEKVNLSNNKLSGFSYYESAFNYHINDVILDSKTTVALFRKSYKQSKWASRVPLRTSVPASVRKIYGLRTGAYAWKGTLNINTILRLQGQHLTELKTIEHEAIPASVVNYNNQPEPPPLFSTINSLGLFIGASLTQIKNILIDFEGYEPGNDDSIFSIYMDVLFSPTISIDNLVFEDRIYLSDVIQTSAIGVRLGMDGKFNRSLGWAYGAEVGYRPSATKGSFFTQFKIALPMLGSKLESTVTDIIKSN